MCLSTRMDSCKPPLIFIWAGNFIQPNESAWLNVALMPLGSAGGQVNQPLQNLDFLRTGNRMLPADDETGHAIDAKPVGPKILRID